MDVQTTMDKTDEECMDMALDMQDTLSLNPFDRPPNMLMDEDLNRVTQEELEANLSTECPTNYDITDGGNKTNDMWEQLIQSVLEDSSTQETLMIKHENQINSDDEKKEEAEEENQMKQTNGAQLIDEVIGRNDGDRAGDGNDHGSDDADDESVNIKNEVLLDFSCEEEKLLIHDIDKCYYVEPDICQIEEVYALNKHDDNQTEANGLWHDNMSNNNNNNNGSDNKSEEGIGLGYMQWNNVACSRSGDLHDIAEDKLSNIMSDHCYISQERDTRNAYNEVDILRRHLINHLRNKIDCNRKTQHDKELNILVDVLLNDINEKKIMKIVKHFKDEECNELTTAEDNNCNIEKEKNEIFVKAESPPLTRHNSLEIVNHKSTVKAAPREPDIKMSIINKNNTVNKKEEKFVELSDNLSNMETIVNNNLTWEALSEPLEHQILDENLTATISLKNRPNDDVDDNDADLDTSYDINENLKQSESIFDKLKHFATLLRRDCNVMAVNKSYENEEILCGYIKEQYQQYQLLFMPFCKPELKDIEVQVQLKAMTRQKRQKLNMESKKKLLKHSETSTDYTSTSSSSSPSSSSASSSSVSDDDDVDNQGLNDGDLNSKTHARMKGVAAKTLTTSIKSTLNVVNSELIHHTVLDYDDGVPLAQYVQSEIFTLDNLSNNSSLSSDESTTGSLITSVQNRTQKSNQLTTNIKKSPDDNYVNDLFHEKTSVINNKAHHNNIENCLTTSPITTAQNSLMDGDCDALMQNSESDKENKEKRSTVATIDEEDKNDKEIERLINLDALSKRSQHSGSSSKNSEKTKTKNASSKSLNNAYDIMDVEFGSDDSKSEAEDEIITEKQFLVRCNEDIKNQMLNESSSDSDDLDDGHNDDDLINLPSDNENDENGGNSPLVEKFLKSFKVDDSDKELNDDDNHDNDNDDDDDDDDNMPDSDKEDAAPEKIETEIDPLVKNKTTDEGESAIVNGEKTKPMKCSEEPSPTTSDIELLNDNLLYRKRNAKPKQLDKLLADVEKRKRISRMDEELISLSSESSDVEAVDEEESSDKLRAIKPMLRPDQLAGETIKAQKSENERIARLEKKHNMLNKVLKEHPEVDKDKDLILDYIKETKTFVKVHPDIVQFLKPHQCDGVRFMYDSCYGGADFLKKSAGSGCILAHCMGLGKTLQLIALLHTVISYKELKTTKILVLCPKSTVMNWADEILRWLGPLRQKNLKVYTFSDTSDINEKLNILREWSLSNSSRAGCLLIGYEAFRTLVFYHSYKKRGNINPVRLEEIRKNVNSFLLEPGADLVVCDEGHIIKNSKSAISLSVAKIVTPRRIVLTGTPIQNNLKEYYSMVNFIKPLFLGTEKEFANLYANPIRNGQHKDSGKNDIKIMKQRSFVLHKKLSKFVQRKEAELLKTFLPKKFEYVLFIPMTEVQNNLYTFILNAIANREDNHRGRGLITDYTCLRKIWTHPKVLENAWKNAVHQKSKRDRELNIRAKNYQSDDDQPDDIYDSQTGQMSVINDWWRHLLTERDLESVMPSNKLRTMFNILQMCEEKGEKCLIFSAFVAVLNVVEYFFQKITEKDLQIFKELNINPNSKSQWILGEDYYRLDGKTPKSLRHQMINVFNDVLNKRARVFLISAKAGGQGINLIGANRVIILDTSWNPSNDQQNIFRVFRLGQKRNCYIYRLLAMGTMEEKVYSRSVTKQAMSFRVVDIQQIDRHYSMAELAELYTLTKPDYTNRPTPLLPQDSILARLLRSFPDLVYKYHEHDSLLENKIEQELSEQEKTEAWTAYERDLQMSSEVREMPNLEEFQNNFLASKLQNYLSPFTGLDVSSTNSNSSNNNNHNNNSNKNMSSLFNYHSFGQPFLQTMIAQSNNPSAAAATQQYLDFYNYYKNLNSTYTDLSSYTNALSNANLLAGRYPATAGSTGPTTVTNPLTALGDLSMLGSAALANSSNLVGSPSLGAVPKNLNNNFSSLLPQLPNTSIYSAGASNLATPNNMANVANVGQGITGGANAVPNPTASLLSAYEQYAQSLRAPYNNMYSYASDFGLGSSGSTILDKTKIKPSNKQAQPSNTNITLTNKSSMPVNTSTKDNLNMYSAPTTFSMPRTKSKTINLSNNTAATNNSNTTETSTAIRSQTSNPLNDVNKEKNSMMMSGRNEITNDLINYRRNESKNNARNLAENLTKSGNNIALGQNQNHNRTHPQHKTDERDNKLAAATAAATKLSAAGMTTQSQIAQSSNSNKTNTPVTSCSNSNNNSSRMMKSTFGSKGLTVQKTKPIASTQSAATSVGKNPKSSTTIAPASQISSANMNLDGSRSNNMSISYVNSANNSKSISASSPSAITTTTANNAVSPLNMGIVYPHAQTKLTNAGKGSEMQIIPTSSPPGTSSISKQLSDLSPSISLTALKAAPPTTNAATSVSKALAFNAQSTQSANVTPNKLSYTKTVTGSIGSTGSNNNSGNSVSGGRKTATITPVTNQNKSSSISFNNNSNAETNNQLTRMKLMQNNNKKMTGDQQNFTNTNLAGLKVGLNTQTISTANVTSTAKKSLQNLGRSMLTITPTKGTATSSSSSQASVMSINASKGTTASSAINSSANGNVMNSIALAKLTAAAVLAKSNSNNSNNNKTQRQSNISSNGITATNIPTTNVSIQKTQSSNSPAATLSPLSYATIKRAIVKKDINNRTMHQQQQQQQITLTSNNNSISIKPVITSTPVSTAKTAQNHNNNNNNSNNLTKTIIKQQQQQQRNSPIPKLTPISSMLSVTSKGGTLQNRLPITITASGSGASSSSSALISSSSVATPMSSSSISLSSSTASANALNISRNTVNIRPVDGKSNTVGANNVYIIETNINDKKVAIGTPTKGGGGTTVTKVPLNAKRKAAESPSKDLRIEAKRFKE